MSDNRINEDDLNHRVTADDRIGGQAVDDHVSISGQSSSRMSGMFAAANRKRLIFISCVGLFLLGALIYTFASFEPEQKVMGGGGVVSTTGVSAQQNNSPSMLQREELDRYNEKALPQIQQQTPTAHPLLLTEPNNPFVEKSEFKAPGKVSEIATVSDQPAQRPAYVPPAQPSAYYDDYLEGLIEAEAATPKLYTVAWSYATKEPAGKAVKAVKGGQQAAEQATAQAGRSQCAVKATRAGTMFMATADLALNSDVGGPVSLTIRNGRLRGAQLLGKFERKEEWLRMDLNKLVTSSETVGVEAIGLDMNTTLNAVEGKVDRHIMYRYGWWGVGSVLAAIGKAAESNADKTVYATDGVIVENMKSETSRETKIALGSLGQDIGDVMQDRINRPITVSVKVGDEIGVFFLDDVCLNSNARS